MKVTRKKESVSLKKNVEFTDWRSERGTNSTHFIGLSVFKDQYSKKNWPYLIFLILLILLKFFLHFQLCQTNLNQFAKCYSYNLFVRYFHAIWSVDSILVNNSRTKILPGTKFGMESEVPHSFSFQIVPREIKCQIWKKKKKKKPYFGALFAKIF